MSRFGNKDHVRAYLQAADSPMFPVGNQYLGSATNSPISDLAHNLSGAYLGSTPRRRLSLASVESNTPTPLKNKLNESLELIDSSASSDLPLSENRILKQSPKSCASGKAASGPSASRPRVVPWRLGPCHGNYDKENISSETTLVSHSAHEGSSSILSLVHSPPSKRLGHLLASPLRARQPLEDYDPNSQDSGYGNGLHEAEDCRALETSPSTKTKLASSSYIRVSKRLDESITHEISIGDSHEICQHTSYSSTSTTEVSTVTSPTRNHPVTKSSGSITPGKKVSPGRSLSNLWPSSQARSPILLHSHSSGAESIDDGFLEIFEMEKTSMEASETACLPSGIGSLLSGPIVKNSLETQEQKKVEILQGRPAFRRCLSLIEGGVQTPPSSKVRLCLFGKERQSKSAEKENADELPEVPFGFKRPEPPEGQIGQIRSKRRRFATFVQSPDFGSSQTWISETEEVSCQESSSTPPVLHRSISDSEAVIKRALQRSSTEPDLIGDFSRPYSLPLIPGRHQDLKTITCDTLADLLHGEYDHCIDSFHIIDCRYPYEYDGGHVKGAKNLFTKDQILKELIKNSCTESPNGEKSSNSDNASEGDSEKKETAENKPLPKREILVFHCEFSSERGPSLSRFLRNSDRAWNKECYPALQYPEIYLLHGGYKEFFDKHSDLCEPRSYLPMADPRYESDYRSCRAKSKSWTGGMGTSGTENTRVALRGSLKRLGL